MRITAIYALLAAIATAINLLAQTISLHFYSNSAAVAISIAVGTIIGLITKYLLDKRYIFKFSSKSLSHDRSVFFLYTFTGIFTTVIFWGTELAFHYIFDSAAMRYLGGALGLSIGYLAKYQLDRRYVFTSKALA